MFGKIFPKHEFAWPPSAPLVHGCISRLHDDTRPPCCAPPGSFPILHLQLGVFFMVPHTLLEIICTQLQWCLLHKAVFTSPTARADHSLHRAACTSLSHLYSRVPQLGQSTGKSVSPNVAKNERSSRTETLLT